MRLRRLAVLVLAGTALTGVMGVQGTVNAEDVSVNLDALGPEPKKAPTKPAKPVQPNAVRSDIVPDPAPAETAPTETTPNKPTPKPNLKPVPAAAPASTAAQGEIDFIGKTKKAQGVTQETSAAADGAPAVRPASTPRPPVMATPIPDEPEAAPKPPAAARPPVMATPIPDDPAPPLATTEPVAPSPASPALTTVAPVPPAAKTAAPAKPKPAPATVQVNTNALSGDAPASGQPRGTPLTAIAPDGVLFVPQNVDALPQPVSVPEQPAAPEPEDELKPLTLPPSLPEVPHTPAPKPASPAQPSANATPPSTQTVAAATPPSAQKPAVAGDRASVLAGQATAVELTFEAGQDALTADAKAALDQIAEPLKATGLRVQLAAYSGPPGNNTSDARRLSLKRALAVRDYLGGHGVAKSSVNIAAFGGALQGQTDRVDLMVKTDQVGRLTGQQ